MTSNTVNSSASDSVKTRPRWKAYFGFISEGFKKHQQRIALLLGYLLVAGLFYNLGKFAVQSKPPEIVIEEPAIDLSKLNDNLNAAIMQSEASPQAQTAGETISEPNCEGKIKGNIGSSGKIYHLPGGASYKRTIPELCFDTEEEAKKTGFRKSLR
jgi:hypothetical protein